MAVRARDVRVLVKEHGAEKGLIRAVEALAEEMSGYRKDMMSLAELVNQCVDLTSQMTTVGDAMKAQLQEIKRRDEQGISVGSIPPSDC